MAITLEKLNEKRQAIRPVQLHSCRHQRPGQIRKAGASSLMVTQPWTKLHGTIGVIKTGLMVGSDEFVSSLQDPGAVPKT